MGLDNGIVLKCRKNQFKLPRWLESTGTVHYNIYGHKTSLFTYELTYWRKCYDIRNTILDKTSCYTNGYSKLSIDDINKIIIIIIKKYYTISGIKSWKDDYWEYGWVRFVEGLRFIRNLLWLKRFMKIHTDNNYKVYFYDSY